MPVIEEGEKAAPLVVHGIAVEPVGNLIRLQFRGEHGELVQEISLEPHNAGQLAVGMAGLADAMITQQTARSEAVAPLVGPGGRILTAKGAKSDGN